MIYPDRVLESVLICFHEIHTAPFFMCSLLLLEDGTPFLHFGAMNVHYERTIKERNYTFVLG